MTGGFASVLRYDIYSTRQHRRALRRREEESSRYYREHQREEFVNQQLQIYREKIALQQKSKFKSDSQRQQAQHTVRKQTFKVQHSCNVAEKRRPDFDLLQRETLQDQQQPELLFESEVVRKEYQQQQHHAHEKVNGKRWQEQHCVSIPSPSKELKLPESRNSFYIVNDQGELQPELFNPSADCRQVSETSWQQQLTQCQQEVHELQHQNLQQGAGKVQPNALYYSNFQQSSKIQGFESSSTEGSSYNSTLLKQCKIDLPLQCLPPSNADCEPAPSNGASQLRFLQTKVYNTFEKPRFKLSRFQKNIAAQRQDLRTFAYISTSLEVIDSRAEATNTRENRDTNEQTKLLRLSKGDENGPQLFTRLNTILKRIFPRSCLKPVPRQSLRKQLPRVTFSDIPPSDDHIQELTQDPKKIVIVDAGKCSDKNFHRVKGQIGRPSEGKNCLGAFKCCRCGRVVFAKKHRKEQAQTSTCAQDAAFSAVNYNSKGFNFHFLRRTWCNMTSYQIFSVACILVATLLLYFAFQTSLFHSTLDHRTGPLRDLYFVVGIISFVRIIWSIGLAICRRCHYDDSLRTVRDAGQWAVITGCTNGIGKEYARQIAAKGMNVCLISRNNSLLMELARDIANKFHVRTMTIQADFNIDKDTLYNDIGSQLQALDIGVLVNNVGVSHDTLDHYHINTPDSLTSRMICVNMLSMAKMCQLILPGMVSRKRGVILNISSGFGRNPSPLMALYSATKSFADHFSQCIEQEYEQHGIHVQSVTPYIVSTNMTKNAPEGLMVPSASRYVRNVLKTVGATSRTHGYLPHSIMGTILDNSPWFVQMIYMKLFRYRANKHMAHQQQQKIRK